MIFTLLKTKKKCLFFYLYIFYLYIFSYHIYRLHHHLSGIASSLGGSASGTGTGNGGNSSHSSPSRMRGGPDANFEKQFVKTLQKVCKTIEKNEMRLADQDRRDFIKQEWQQVALIVDRLLLIFFIIGTVGVTLGIILDAPHSLSFFLGRSDEGLGT